MTLPHSSQTKLCKSVASSQLHTRRNSSQLHLLLKLPSSPSVPSLKQKYPNVSSPATLQHALLIQSPHTFSKQSLLHSYQHSHSLLQLASSSRHWCLQIEQPQAQHPPSSIHQWQSTSPQEVWDLRASDASWSHHRYHFPERILSQFLAGGMNFPPSSGMLNPWEFSKRHLKTHLFRHHLTSS